jgi:hypothetical protein
MDQQTIILRLTTTTKVILIIPTPVRKPHNAHIIQLSVVQRTSLLLYLSELESNRCQGLIRYDTIRYDTIRFDTIRYDTIRFDSITSGCHYIMRYYFTQQFINSKNKLLQEIDRQNCTRR